MISSISFTGKTIIVLLGSLVFLSGCAAAGKDVVGAQQTPLPLEVHSLSPNRSAPQAAQTTKIRWSAFATGGVGAPTYEYWLSDGKAEKLVQRGPSSVWDWSPEGAGKYRVKVAVRDSVGNQRDSVGNQAESAWSFPYSISNKILYTVSIAVLPLENLSGTVAPLEEIRDSLIERLKDKGFTVIEEQPLEDFMARHRLRYTGGIDSDTAKSFREETGAGAVLITSLELYDDQIPPKIALTSRLVSTGESPDILWMDSTGMAGDDSPGILGLGMIEDSTVLLKNALLLLADSLEGTMLGEKKKVAEIKRNKFRPKLAFRSHGIPPVVRQTVAVLPFFNESRRKYAGEIMALHFVREMVRLEELDVIEPGVVRKELLKFRIILEDGISLANADLILASLDADLIFTGKVLEYQDYKGPVGVPAVDFSSLMIDRKSREMVWASKSYNRGSDGVYFFDWGRERTANEIAAEMARVVGEMMWKEKKGVPIP